MLVNCIMGRSDDAAQGNCRRILLAQCALHDATSDDGSAAEGYEPVRPLRFDALQRQQPPRRPEIDSSLEAEPPPFGEKGAETGKQTEKETADCPICCEDLGRSPQEVGALTYQGKRIERDLYHVGCFTLMLSHKGAFSGERLKDGCFDNLKIAWGQSPTTRQEVDGFVSMPSMSDQKALIAFLDWKGTGRLDVSELATVAAVQLPLHARAMDNFIRENFQVDGDGNITVEELEQKVLPYIGEHFESITNAKEEEKKKAAKLRCDFLLMRLDSAVGGTIVASSTQSKWVQAALDELSQCVAQGDPIAVAVVSRLMTHPEPEVRSKAAQLLPKIVTKGDPQAFESLSAALGHDSSQVRELVVEVLGQVSLHNDRCSFEEVSSRLHDDSPHVQVAAVRAITKMANFEDGDTLEVLCARLRTASAPVQRAVLEALPHVAAPCSEPALGAVRAALKERDTTVQVAAMATLAALAPGHLEALKDAEAYLSDDEAALRRAALLAVAALSASMGEEGRAAALSYVLERVQDSDAEMRAVAMQGIARLADPGDRIALSRAQGALKDKSPPVRREALRALQSLVVTVDKRLLRTVTSISVNDKDLIVRKVAEEVLQKLQGCPSSRRFWAFCHRS